jgi:uncharacterized protein YrzB (UPF0473 family)
MDVTISLDSNENKKKYVLLNEIQHKYKKKRVNELFIKDVYKTVEN